MDGYTLDHDVAARLFTDVAWRAELTALVADLGAGTVDLDAEAAAFYESAEYRQQVEAMLETVDETSPAGAAPPPTDPGEAVERSTPGVCGLCGGRVDGAGPWCVACQTAERWRAIRRRLG